MQITISPSDADAVIKKMQAGDIGGITLEQYMQVSFLSLISGEEVHLEERVMYGGNLFLLHACVSQVTVTAPVAGIKRVV